MSNTATQVFTPVSNASYSQVVEAIKQPYIAARREKEGITWFIYAADDFQEIKEILDGTDITVQYDQDTTGYYRPDQEDMEATDWYIWSMEEAMETNGRQVSQIEALDAKLKEFIALIPTAHESDGEDYKQLIDDLKDTAKEWEELFSFELSRLGV
jgi:hypothetical protein